MKINSLSIKKKKNNGIFLDVVKFLLYFFKCTFRIAIALPGLVLMGPTTSIIAYQAEKERIKCLQNSDVKQKGTDVVGSYKILLSMIYFPITTGIHTLLMYYCLNNFTDY